MSLVVLAQGARGYALGAAARIQGVHQRATASRKARATRPAAERTASSDVFVLSVPLFIELFMQIMVGNVNQMMLAPQGAGAAAAVGNALQILNIVTIALSAMGTATTVLATRVLGNGAEHKRSLAEIATLGLVVNATLGLAVSAALFAFWPQFFAWLNIDPAVHGMASSYLLIVGSTTLFQGAFFAVTALLRGFARVGDVMAASLVMNAVNILLCALLVNGLGPIPAFGVEGSATAAVTARLVGLVLAVFMLLRHTDVRPSLQCLRPFPWPTLKGMMRVGIPSSGEQMNYDLAQIVILSFINVLGTTVVTVKVYCSMLASIAYLYSIALSQATQIILGYLMGAGKLDVVRRRVWMADLIAASLTTAVSLVLWLNFDAVIGLLTPDPLVHELGRQIMLVEVFLGIGRALNIVMVRTLIALGDARTPVTVNIAFSWVFAVGGGWLLGVGWGWGLVGMWVAMCIDEWLRAAFLIVAFARGGWRKRAEAQGLGQANKDLSAAAPHVKNSSFAAPGVKQDEIVGVNAPSFIGVTSLDAQRSATAADAPDLSLF
ncbi:MULTISPECIES: MATE family efflux transporter [Gordonibacter]|uniref:MATE family efflux transporter n=1 Tax=Gordonibacter faecis TaxID=3047475 RepID=A0ABT7DKN4_9ACTN|nr:MULTISPECIES: MATE family efflux transporter [unclassified Gordonibacter]MDJ1649957.1 MATE family efflux transporter [Gordonibacter sp. KGMB12511]HIW75889.1 MATE family efflux transporter [Candidatus Gordonibacter avicola]